MCLYAPILGIIPTQHFKLSMSAPIFAPNCTIQWNWLRYNQYKIHHRVHISVEAKAAKYRSNNWNHLSASSYNHCTAAMSNLVQRSARSGFTFQKFANAHLLDSLSSAIINSSHWWQHKLQMESVFRYEPKHEKCTIWSALEQMKSVANIWAQYWAIQGSKVHRRNNHMPASMYYW